MLAIVGYGIRFAAPGALQVGRMGDKGPHPDALVVARIIEGELRNAMIIPGAAVEDPAIESVRLGDEDDAPVALRMGSGGTQVVLGAGMTDLEGIAELGAAAWTSSWSIATESYRIPWPIAFVMRSTPAEAAWQFELKGEDGELILIRGPLHGKEQTPTPPELVAPGQRMIIDGISDPQPWIEVAYTHEDSEYRQRHIYAVVGEETVLLVTAQTPTAHSAKIMPAAMEIAAGARLISGGS